MADGERGAMRRGLATTTQRTSTTLRLFYNDYVDVTMPPKHRFPMGKYRAVRTKLQRELESAGLADFHPSPDASELELSTAHDEGYVSRVFHNQLSESEVRRIGLPVHHSFLKRQTTAVGGTIAATRALLERPPAQQVAGCKFDIAGHIAGGTHHAYRGHGEGFCLFNDIAVAAAVAQRDYSGMVSNIMVVDLDVHQGNGTAEIFRDDPAVTTLSMHCSKNIFSKREESDYDLEVGRGACVLFMRASCICLSVVVLGAVWWEWKRCRWRCVEVPRRLYVRGNQTIRTQRLTDKNNVQVAPECDDDTYMSKLEAWLPGCFEQHPPDLVFFQVHEHVCAAAEFGRSLARSLGCGSGLYVCRWKVVLGVV